MEKREAMKWVKGLRSGKYKQAMGTLAKFEELDDEEFKCVGHCCLGVLADLQGYDLKDRDFLMQKYQNGVASMISVDLRMKREVFQMKMVRKL